MIYVLSMLLAFVISGVKGFQHKNVIGGHMKSVFFTSYCMAFLDVIGVALIVRGGWTLAISAGTGAAFGMLTAIKVHDYLFKGKHEHKDPQRLSAANDDGRAAAEVLRQARRPAASDGDDALPAGGGAPGG